MPPTSECASLICEAVRLLSVPTSAGGLAPRVRIKEGAVAVTAFGLENQNENPENERLGVNAGLSGCMTP